MKLIGLMVTKNEATRHLHWALHAMLAYCDDVYVYDDQSTDDTPSIARDKGAKVMVRPDDVPSFLEDESAFRQAAWRALPGDKSTFALCLDADELLVAKANGGSVRLTLQDNVASMLATGATSLEFPVREVFNMTALGTPMVRTDGFWGSITARRLCEWQEEPTFDPRIEGGGSLPSLNNDQTLKTIGIDLMHYGYLRQEDREAKQRRYTGGMHNQAHVASITQWAMLKEWT